MKKLIKLVSVGLIFSGLIFGNLPVQAEAPATTASDGIVMLRVFTLDADYNVTESNWTTGVMISKDGLAIAPLNVLMPMSEGLGNPVPAAYVACLVRNGEETMSCSYTAGIVAVDEEKDLALIKVTAAGDAETETFEYLALPETDTVKPGDQVSVVNYDSYEKMVYNTPGVVTGRSEDNAYFHLEGAVENGEEYGAYIPYGVIVDMQNRLIGFSSQENDEYSADGLSLASSVEWVNENKSKEADFSDFSDQAAVFAITQENINNSNQFVNNNPGFKISKPDSWKYEYSQEGLISVINPAAAAQEDGERGSLLIKTYRLPYLADLNSFAAEWDKFQEEVSLPGDWKLSRTTLNGQDTLKVQLMMDGQEIGGLYIVPVRNYYLFIAANYGTSGVDRLTLEKMFQSLTVTDTNEGFVEIKHYTNTDPYFNVSTTGDWVILLRNDVLAPIEIHNKTHGDMAVKLQVIATDESSETNQDVLKMMMENVEVANRFTSEGMDIRQELSDIDMHYVPAAGVGEVLKVLLTTKMASTNTPAASELSYMKNLKEKGLMVFSMSTFNSDKTYLETLRKELDRLLSNFSFTAIDSDGDGLTDETEALYGTDVDNPDTDGDGYDDALEIDNGYDPLGPGRLASA